MFKRITRGFTMIELLVVIAVIGILAVALLATLNPLEQIRKGRDTRTRTDMSQLLGAVERYNASLGYFPWQDSEGDDLAAGSADIPFLQVGGDGGSAVIAGFAGEAGDTTVKGALTRLTSTSEVKASFVDRVTADTYAITYLFYDDETTGGTVTACFTPESQSFQKEAFDRCKAGTSSWSSEFVANNVYNGAGSPCPDGNAAAYDAASFDPTSTNEMICLP